MDRHVQALGTLNVIYGALGFLISLGVLIQHGNLYNIHEAFNEDVYGLVAVALVLYHLAVGIPCVIAGLFVKRYIDGARVALIVLSALNTLAAPVGTALGAYGLWVLMTPETDPLFADRAQAPKKKAGEKTGDSRQKRAQTSILPSAE